MQSRMNFWFPVLLLLADTAAVIMSFVAAYILRVKLDDRALINQIPSAEYMIGFLWLIPLWLIAHGAIGLYRRDVYSKRFAESGRVLVGSFIGVLLMIGYEFVANKPLIPARLVAVYVFAISFVLGVIFRQFFWTFKKHLHRRGRGVNRIMIIGSSPNTKELARLLSDTGSTGYQVVALVGSKDVVPDNFKGRHISRIEEVIKNFRRYHLDGVIQTRLYEDDNKNRRILELARQNQISYRFVPAEADFFTARSTVELFHYFPMINVHQTALIGWGGITKRIFDIIISGLSLLILSPLMLAISLLVKIDGGKALYSSTRVTQFGRRFKSYKFRSMHIKYSGKDPAWAFVDLGRPDLLKAFRKTGQVAEDPRVTPLGRFLRRTSLDELPQLINVLKGDISLVGPRAIVPEEIALLERDAPLLLHIKSGLTGLAQVSGRSELPMAERTKLNVFYVQNWSFLLDLRILFRTIFIVLRREGTR